MKIWLLSFCCAVVSRCSQNIAQPRCFSRKRQKFLQSCNFLMVISSQIHLQEFNSPPSLPGRKTVEVYKLENKTPYGAD